ncbi:MAG: YceI family protein [Verrucomicrobia bacterium]|nr:YceI family protein [Verrucomicrobiota bacterium]
MKNQSTYLLFLSAAFLTFLSTGTAAERWVTQNAHVSFFSSTPAEDIHADNNSVVVVVNSDEDSLGFSIPMQAFEFEKALMQKHFNQKTFLNTKKYPQATFQGKIEDADNINFKQNGEYEVTVSGTMSIRGIEQEVSEKGTITVSDNILSLNSEFNLTLEDYGIAFKKGKPAKNIAKTVKITIDAENLIREASAGA